MLSAAASATASTPALAQPPELLCNAQARASAAAQNGPDTGNSDAFILALLMASVAIGAVAWRVWGK